MNNEIRKFLNELTSSAGTIVNGDQLARRAQHMAVQLARHEAEPIAYRVTYNDGHKSGWFDGQPSDRDRKDVDEGVIGSLEFAYAEPAQPAGAITGFDLTTSDGGRGFVAELFKNHLRRHDFTRYINQTLAADFACALAGWLEPIVNAAVPQTEAAQSADERMKAAGMFTVAELLSGTPLDGLVKHAGVNDLATFAQWVEMKRTQYLKQHAAYELGDKPKDDMYEWMVAHCAVYTEVHVNLKAAMAEPAERTPKDYAIEHGGYLATAADNVQKAYQAYGLAQMNVDEGGDDGEGELAEAVDNARTDLHEALNTMRGMTYEFRKRCDRVNV
ncbi:hypothetical protein [Pseudomonas sp. NPDC090208]|uniref:hypothetical protein n=1 Tax=Pseudomonas sp. NPDC090208 TaxID=3364478 RepID=UPI0038021662